MKSTILSVIIALMATGCASTYSQFKDKSLPETQYAKLRPLKINNGWTPMVENFALAKDISDGKKNWVELGGFMVDAPSKVNMLPGEYMFIFQCRTGSSYAFPMAVMKLEAGKVYSSRCFNAVGDKVGVEVKESTIDAVEK